MWIAVLTLTVHFAVSNAPASAVAPDGAGDTPTAPPLVSLPDDASAPALVPDRVEDKPSAPALVSPPAETSAQAANRPTVSTGGRMALEAASSALGELTIGTGLTAGLFIAALASNGGGGDGFGFLNALVWGSVIGVPLGAMVGPVITDVALGVPVGSWGAVLGGLVGSVVGAVFLAALSGNFLGVLVALAAPPLFAMLGAEAANALAKIDSEPPRPPNPHPHRALVTVARF